MLNSMTISASLRLTLFCIFVHVGAMLCVVFSSASNWIQIPMLILGTVSLGWCLLQHALVLLPTSVMKVWVDASGTWHLESKNGTVRTAQLQGNSLVAPCLVLLNFKSVSRRFGLSVMVCQDNVSVIMFRRLRLYLL